VVGCGACGSGGYGVGAVVVWWCGGVVVLYLRGTVGVVDGGGWL
jgi:hypothetical protein